MKIIISNESKVPIYEQLKAQIKDEILSGGMKEGDPLPSIRVLAKDLKISVITTMRAYGDLESEGYVVNVQGKGCYVKPQNPELLKEKKLKYMEENLQNAIEASRLCGVTEDELIELLKTLYEENGNE